MHYTVRATWPVVVSQSHHVVSAVSLAGDVHLQVNHLPVGMRKLRNWITNNITGSYG